MISAGFQAAARLDSVSLFLTKFPKSVHDSFPNHKAENHQTQPKSYIKLKLKNILND